MRGENDYTDSTMSLLSYILNRLPVRRGKVVFYSFTDSYADQPRYIAEELLRRQLPCEPVWLTLKHRAHTPFRTVCGRMRAWKELATAQVIVSNSRLGKYFHKGCVKKPGQVYIQTWHGSFGIKKMEKDAHELRHSYLHKAKLDSQNIDYLLSNSRWLTEVMRASFFYDGPILELGSPRNDLLLAPEAVRERVAQEARRTLGLPQGVKIALYAPTFRAAASCTTFEYLDYARLQSALESKFGGEWRILVRLHPGHGGERMPGLLKGGVDVSHYPDMTELLLLADALVSDYSSCAYDYLLTGKPSFCYAPDVAEYETNRGLYYPLSAAPMPVAESHEQLETAIRNFDPARYAQAVETFLKEKGNVEDGHAAQRAVDLIEKHLG